ncbi:hypothetical protein ZWY2020_053639 [Hordeum vulgare]|nr:hypothetical protein ZWY2020_053639 [Hordeum vulgare]
MISHQPCHVFPPKGRRGRSNTVWVVWRGVYKELRPSLCTQLVAGTQLLSVSSLRQCACQDLPRLLRSG